MNFVYIVLLAVGAASWGSESLEYTRQYRNIDNPAGLCLAGVQHRYVDYLGQQVWLYTFDGKLIGPLLVVDVAAPEDAGIMEGNGLAIDVNCPGLVHTNGILLTFSQERHQHPDVLNFRAGDSIVSRIRHRLHYNHRLCSDNPAIGCIRQFKEWLEK